ncbi:hypothetical protein ZWY2020_038382 [Hordeum vulgare]|nr:hypothetical protein ZWY2020_038382 [Hordeum vulgare]
MASGSRSLLYVSAPYHGEQTVVSGLGLSGSTGSARSSSVARVKREQEFPATEGPWRRHGPSRKAMWPRRKALHRQQEAGRPASHSSSERRQIPPDLHGLCFGCFKGGHRREDCTNDPLCIRYGLSDMSLRSARV